MRVAVLNPMFGKDFIKSARWAARSRSRVQRHPDYLATAAAVVEAAGHALFFMDCQARNLPIDAVLPLLKEFKPDLCVYQATTPSIHGDIAAARACKGALGGLHVLVGAHVSAEPESTLRLAAGAVDAVCRHEYDYTVRDLANGVPLGDCLGISYLDGDAYVATLDRPYIEDLDGLPFPAWRHVNLYDYRDADKLYPFVTSITGRGCRYRCSYCQLPQVMHGHAYRTRSVENVVEELAYDKRLLPALREVMFEDDTLTARVARERLVRLCEELVRRNLGLAWSANARVDLDDLEVLRLMKRAGCRTLTAGFEFGDQEILNNVRKGTTIPQIHRFVERAKQAGLRVHGCFLIGGPGETRETAEKTIALSQALDIDSAQFAALVAYPGTTYYEQARKQGAALPRDWRDWVTADLEQTAPVNLTALSRAEIEEFVDRAFRAFYLRRRQAWRLVRETRSWADLRAKVQGGVGFAAYLAQRWQKGRG